MIDDIGDLEDDGELPSDIPNVVDEKAIRKRRLTQKQAERQDNDWILGTLRSEVGRRFLWNLLSACHTFDERFACGPNGFPQPEATWFEAGQQAFGLRLYHSWLRVDPLAISAMHRECDPRFKMTKEIK